MARREQIAGYQLLATLGYGARSTIYAVKDKSDQVFALKHVIKKEPKDQRFIDQAILEHEVSSQFNHESLRRSFKMIRHRKLMRLSEIFVIMEMVDGLTLEQHKPNDLIELCKLCQQVALGLGAMHEKGYVHADIKPNNILATDHQTIKIIDFGQSCPVGTIKKRIQGTPDYIAPEQVLRRKIMPKTDIFNLGATMYWLMTGGHMKTLIPNVKPGSVNISGKPEPPTPPIEINPQLPPALSTLVMNCVEFEPANRPEDMDAVHDRLGMAIAQLQRQQEQPQPQTQNSDPDSKIDKGATI